MRAPTTPVIEGGRSRTVVSPRPVDLAHTLAPLRRGQGDPCTHRDDAGGHWQAVRTPAGPVTYRLVQHGRDTVHARAWGPGAQLFLDELEIMLCLDENLDDFTPEHPLVRDAHRRHPGLRMLRTRRVFEALVPSVLEQKVHTVSALASWRKLVRRYGEPAPGPSPAGLLLPPAPETWRRIPSWEYHRAGVGPQRASTIVRAAAVADSLERAAAREPAEAARMLCSVPGIGVWTAAEIAQRAFGDADALSVGDYHLAAVVGWTLLGRPLDDDGMVEYLEPLRPHRYRAVRLLEISGAARRPKFGPRTPLTDHTWH
ncbi:MAG TPA: DNA-3-methyladenine glycosylase 2 family protein [Nocardia sp.]|uniref:DNA-3-methyladenine glycosylase family protein n=1 Tax=Nocardia sp. TaxID=1821 RepID=UPI002B4B04DB|nr:DNA-3-methyladenine glycosylase 2 family protein [Nocardia sp.]HLS77170.1 DNA-3-methyladenine glycosylase 2 family protein [Nocardia sp.]